MPVLESPPTTHATTVIDRREPGPGIVVVGLAAPSLAAAARPGQFVMVVPPRGENVAIALGIYEAASERVSLMVVVVGHRTAELAALVPGDKLKVLGPLGNGFDVAGLGNDVALVAGGVGIASLLLLAERLAERGAATRLYYGARTAAALADVELFERLNVAVSLATDDGSRGHRGYVTELVDMRAGSVVAGCGPSPMLRALGGAAKRANMPAQLSLEESFACGVGACWGCVVPVVRTSAQAPPFPPAAASGDSRDYVHARICKEGPVFWAHDLCW
jgi:dihydroorotate dehydrogenase electron transfer subunit